MCGIVGYTGDQAALPVLISGLKTLEYRGYDSAGVAVVGDRIRVVKAVGKLEVLQQKLVGEKLNGKVGIAHTRWATHGGVKLKNSHPLRDCTGKVALVHNGIVENYRELKAGLEKQGHRFKSETDSEVLVHLIEEWLKREIDLIEAVRLAMRQVVGTYGIAVVGAEEPNKVVAARSFSPLCVGSNGTESMVASDPAAILKLCRQVVFVEDGEAVVIESSGYRVFDGRRRRVRRRPEKLEESAGQTELGDYKHFMLKEIMEQPTALANTLRGRLNIEAGLAVLGGLADGEEKLRRIDKLVITASGSAMIAGLAGKYMLEEYAGIPVTVEPASELKYKQTPWTRGDALLAISQSGETADTLGAVREAKRKGVLTLGVVNSVGSSIARETGAGIYLHAGPEVGVAATKSFTCQLAVMALLTLCLGRQRQMSRAVGRKIAGELAKISELVKTELQTQDKIAKVANKYSRHDSWYFMGRKYLYPVALEGALKLKEISYIHAEGYPGGELKHGPIALVEPGFPVVFLAVRDSMYEKNLAGMEEVKARGGVIIVIATQTDNKIKALADEVIYIPKCLEMLSPILAVVPLQLLAYYVGLKRRIDVDRPRNLAKSVTVE